MFKIAIDGYMGSGKTTLAIELCEKLGGDFKRLDTGAIFRAMAYALLVKNGEEIDEKKISNFLKNKKIEVKFENGVQNMYVDNVNVTEHLREQNVTRMSSAIAVFKAVREKYLKIAKEFAEKYNCVMEGRDIGSVVMPDANVKIFLTADEKTRAKRRYNEVVAKGMAASEKEILEDLRERDKRDSTRKEAPLRPMEDSVIVDNSDMTENETVAYCMEIINETLKKYDKKTYSIAIDGYVCSGKSTIAKLLAKKLGYHVFDTGACYRAIACAYKYIFKTSEINEEVITKFADQIILDVRFIGHEQHVYVNGIDYTKQIRTNEISVLSAKISPYPIIREKVIKIQRQFAEHNNTVMEGRDIGSEVLPNATFKFFVTADEDVRVQRRYNQQRLIDPSITLEQIRSDLEKRDYSDIHREHGAIKIMPDSIIIDTSHQTVEESVDQMLKIIHSKI